MHLSQFLSSSFKPIQTLINLSRTSALMGSNRTFFPSGPVIAKDPQLKTASTSAAGSNDAALIISCPDPTIEERERDFHRTCGQRLARQEQWDDIVHTIHLTDCGMRKTTGGMPIADLVGDGARADVVDAYKSALKNTETAKDDLVFDGIEVLESVLSQHSGEYAIATIVALAHMDMGWARCTEYCETEISNDARSVFKSHFERAAEILAPFANMSPLPPSLAAAQCALHKGRNGDISMVANAYEVLIRLDPSNVGVLRDMGCYLLSCDERILEEEARCTAAYTQGIWGAGAYTWIYFDALTCDDKACANLDVDFFIDGMQDILERTHAQYTVNLLAAYCANVMSYAAGGNDKADQIRCRIAECTNWIVRKHLTELHPMLWAYAARGVNSHLKVRNLEKFAASGEADALGTISALFRHDIAAGRQIVFTKSGPVAQPI